MWRLKTQPLPQPGFTNQWAEHSEVTYGLDPVVGWRWSVPAWLTRANVGHFFPAQVSQIGLVGAFTAQKSANTTNLGSPRPSQPFTSTSLPTEHVSGVLSGGLRYLLWRGEGRPPRDAQVRFTNPRAQDDGGRGHSGKGTGVCSQGMEGTANR